MIDALALKPAGPGDEAFLFEVYASTREAEMALVDWDDARKHGFLRMQFDAQRRYYREQFPGADFQIVVSGNRAAGRLYVDRSGDDLHILDIALLPEHRNAGIGGTLIRRLLTEASTVGKPVNIHVERFNRALRFYERLGFVRVGESGAHYLMQWSTGPAPARSDECGE